MIANFEQLFTQFFGSWKVFLYRLDQINIQINKEAASDQKYTAKFTQLFDIIKEMCNFVDKIKSTEESEFSKLIKQKMDQFVRMLTNIYTEIMIDYNQQHKRLSDLYKQLVESPESTLSE